MCQGWQEGTAGACAALISKLEAEAPCPFLSCRDESRILRDTVVPPLLDALRVLGKADPAAALELAGQLLRGCLGTYLAEDHIEQLSSACEQLGCSM